MPMSSPMQKTVEAVSREYLSVEALLVGPGTKTGMPILYDVPQEVGQRWADKIWPLSHKLVAQAAGLWRRGLRKPWQS